METSPVNKDQIFDVSQDQIAESVNDEILNETLQNSHSENDNVKLKVEEQNQKEANSVAENGIIDQTDNSDATQNQTNDTNESQEIMVNTEGENQQDATKREDALQAQLNISVEDETSFNNVDKISTCQISTDGIGENENAVVNIEERSQKCGVEEEVFQDQTSVIDHENSSKTVDISQNQIDDSAESEDVNVNAVEENEKGSEKEVFASTQTLDLIDEDVKECIKAYLAQQGYNNVTIDVESGSNLGDNFMGFIGKLTATGVSQDGERETFNWIIKRAPNLKEHRDVMNVSVLYEREAYLYTDVFQIFKYFQISKRIPQPFDQHPEHILSYLEDMKETIVMKDMKSMGYVMKPRYEPLDLNHVKLVMKAYAKLHATSYALKEQKPDIFKQIIENTTDTLKNTLLNETALQNQAPLMAATLDVLDPMKNTKAYQMYKKFLDNYANIVRQLLEDTIDSSVVGHGDSWVNNMLWKYDVSGSNIPNKVCLVDWQMARYGSTACDLSYFIFTCTTKEFRDKYYDDMIRLYYYTLCAHANELGCDPQKFLPFEVLEKELKKYSLVGLFPTVMVLYIITRDTSEIPDWRAEDVDKEEMQKQWMKSSRNADAYRERLTGVIVDFYEKGYFNNVK